MYTTHLNQIIHLLCSIIFFLRWRVKKLSTAGGLGDGGIVLILSWRCNFSIYMDIQVYYLDIQAITTHFYAFYWFFMCSFLLFIHFSTLQPLSWKVTFSGTQKPTDPSTVFNLQLGTGLGSLWRGNRCVLPIYKFFFFLKLLILPPKIREFKKKS